MLINDRINKVVKYQGITPRAFALKIGVSPQRFGNYLKDREPDYTTLSNIVETFVDINPSWLLTGRGEMLIPGPDEATAKDMRPQDQRLMDLIREKDEKIEELAKNVGRLEERVESLMKNFSARDNTTDAGDATCADVAG